VQKTTREIPVVSGAPIPISSHPVFFGALISGCLVAIGLAGIISANDDDRPSGGQIAFAQEVSDLLVKE
jgi:hypothetical protein